jgi:hypothetical protein
LRWTKRLQHGCPSRRAACERSPKQQKGPERRPSRRSALRPATRLHWQSPFGHGVAFSSQCTGVYAGDASPNPSNPSSRQSNARPADPHRRQTVPG